MRFRNASAKDERKVNRTFYASIGFLGILLAAGVIFAVLMLNSCFASTLTDVANISPRSISSGPVNLSENHTKSSIDAFGTTIQLRTQRVTITERKTAAERFRTLYKSAQVKAAAQGLTAAPPLFNPGGLPHYFGPYANWANSQMPKGAVTGITLVNGGSGYTSPTVTVKDAYKGVTSASATAT